MKSARGSPSILFFFFRVVLVILSPLHFHLNFRISLGKIWILNLVQLLRNTLIFWSFALIFKIRTRPAFSLGIIIPHYWSIPYSVLTWYWQQVLFLVPTSQSPFHLLLRSSFSSHTHCTDHHWTQGVSLKISGILPLHLSPL